MRIGILKAGQPPENLGLAIPTFPAMIRTALGPAYDYREFDVAAGSFPGSDSAVDAYVITGSSASAYGAEPWIARLREWLKAVDPSTPLVGFCFGHQIMAAAHGGLVERSTKGLAVGLHEYTVTCGESWMDGVDRFVLPVSHYDQVTRPPAASRVIATSDFCRYAALSYGDRRAVSFQGHPEFTLELVAIAIDLWRQRGVIGDAQVEEAKASMRQRDDRGRVIGWIRRFLDDAVAK